MSEVTTIQTVGDYHFYNTPLACHAVLSGLSKDELIRLLLDENRRLTSDLTQVLHNYVNIPIVHAKRADI